MNAMERFEQWCNNPYFDQATRAELRALAEAGDTKEIEDRFYRSLPLAPAVCGAFWGRVATA